MAVRAESEMEGEAGTLLSHANSCCQPSSQLACCNSSTHSLPSHISAPAAPLQPTLLATAVAARATLAVPGAGKAAAQPAAAALAAAAAAAAVLAAVLPAAAHAAALQGAHAMPIAKRACGRRPTGGAASAALRAAASPPSAAPSEPAPAAAQHCCHTPWHKAPPEALMQLPAWRRLTLASCRHHRCCRWLDHPLAAP